MPSRTRHLARGPLFGLNYYGKSRGVLSVTSYKQSPYECEAKTSIIASPKKMRRRSGSFKASRSAPLPFFSGSSSRRSSRSQEKFVELAYYATGKLSVNCYKNSRYGKGAKVSPAPCELNALLPVRS